MPATPHIEKHFTASETIRDIVIGMSDGLTVPFALAAGLTSAAASTHVVVTAGLAEIAAGSIAMGLGGYLAARTDIEHYDNEVKRELWEVDNLAEKEEDEVRDVFRGYGLSEEAMTPVVNAIKADKQRWVDFMMRFELGLERPEPKRARMSAWTIASSYIVGGLVPLLSYMVISDMMTALKVSVLVTLAALFVFGFIKGKFTGMNPFKGAIQTTLIGGVAAGAAFAIARLIS
ncbi:MAG: VIT1/CCC1 transporter family protein [Candidatus Zixiibacteriota bacterium]